MTIRRFIACALLAAGHARAEQDAAPPKPAPASTPSVEIKGAASALRQQDTATKIVITHDEIVKYGDENILDAMKRLPGVTVNGSSVQMRGLGNGYTQFLVNGERPPAGFSLDALSPSMVERIEIVRAATAEFSTQAIAGTINVVLKKSVAKASGEVKGSVGGAPGRHTASTNMSRSDRTDAYSYTLGGSLFLYRSDARSAGLTEARAADGMLTERRDTASANRNHYTGINLNSRLNWKVGKTDTLTWQTFFNHGRYHGDNTDLSVTAVGPQYPLPWQLTSYDGDNGSLRTDLNWVATLADDAKLDSKLSAYWSGRESGNAQLARGPAATPVLDRQHASSTRDRGMSTTGKFAAPWIKNHALAVGWDGGLSIYREHEVQDDAPLPGATAFDFDNSFSAHISRLAVYVQDEWDVTPAWSVYLGARWEGVHTVTTGPALEASSRLSVLSPLMQTLWKIPGRQGDQVRLAVTRTYKAPELRRLVPRHFISSVNSPIEPDFTGNPGLKPELATGIDASFEHYWSEGALISVALSSRDIDGTINNEVRLDGGRWVSAPRNLGMAHVRGLELEAKFPLKAVMQQAPDVDLRASISRNWSYVDGVPAPGNRLEDQRPLSANFGADVKRGPWSGGASFSYVKGGWSRSSVAGWDYSAAQRDLEAYVLYKFSPKTGLRFTARDLLRPASVSGSRYEDVAGSLEDRSTKQGYLGWRVQLEHKL